MPTDLPPPPPPRERMFNVPIVVVGLIAILLGIQGIREWLPLEDDVEMLLRLAFVPGQFTYAVDPDPVVRGLNELLKSNPDQAAVAQYFLGDGTLQWWTVLTYSFLHGDWTHVGLNSLWLAAFGSAVARRLGTGRFLGFCLVTAIAGAAAHYLAHRTDLQPVIGASAAVSGTMAAAVRFAFGDDHPAALFGREAEETQTQTPLLSLRQVFTNRRALSFLAIWFVMNLVSGIAAVPLGITSAAIAWEAHIGGFVVGLLALPLFDRRRELPAAPTDA